MIGERTLSGNVQAMSACSYDKVLEKHFDDMLADIQVVFRIDSSILKNGWRKTILL